MGRRGPRADGVNHVTNPDALMTSVEHPVACFATLPDRWGEVLNQAVLLLPYSPFNIAVLRDGTKTEIWAPRPKPPMVSRVARARTHTATKALRQRK